MINNLKSGDIISFSTTNHERLGTPKSVTVVAVCIYSVAVLLDSSLPNVINTIIMDSGTPNYDPNSREYLVYEGVNGQRAVDTKWIIEDSIEYPSTTTISITLHDVTISEGNEGLQALNNLGINYTVNQE